MKKKQHEKKLMAHQPMPSGRRSNYRVDSFLILSSHVLSPQKGARMTFFLSSAGMKSLKSWMIFLCSFCTLVALRKSKKKVGKTQKSTPLKPKKSGKKGTPTFPASTRGCRAAAAPSAPSPWPAPASPEISKKNSNRLSPHS